MHLSKFDVFSGNLAAKSANLNVFEHATATVSLGATIAVVNMRINSAHTHFKEKDKSWMNVPYDR